MSMLCYQCQETAKNEQLRDKSFEAIVEAHPEFRMVSRDFRCHRASKTGRVCASKTGIYERVRGSSPLLLALSFGWRPGRTEGQLFRGAGRYSARPPGKAMMRNETITLSYAALVG